MCEPENKVNLLSTWSKVKPKSDKPKETNQDQQLQSPLISQSPILQGYLSQPSLAYEQIKDSSGYLCKKLMWDNQEQKTGKGYGVT